MVQRGRDLLMCPQNVRNYVGTGTHEELQATCFMRNSPLNDAATEEEQGLKVLQSKGAVFPTMPPFVAFARELNLGLLVSTGCWGG